MKKSILILAVSFLTLIPGACTMPNNMTETSSVSSSAQNSSDTVSEQNESPEIKAEFARQKIGELSDSDEYSRASEEERKEIAFAVLEELQRNGNIQNLYYDENNRLFSFQFADGILGGVAIKSFSNDTDDLPMN